MVLKKVAVLVLETTFSTFERVWGLCEKRKIGADVDRTRKIIIGF